MSAIANKLELLQKSTSWISNINEDFICAQLALFVCNGDEDLRKLMKGA